MVGFFFYCGYTVLLACSFLIKRQLEKDKKHRFLTKRFIEVTLESNNV